MYQTYQAFLDEFMAKIKQLLKDKKVSYLELQSIFGVATNRSVNRVLNGNSTVSLEAFRELCDRFDLWPEWNMRWDISWVKDGVLEKVFDYHGTKEDLEKALMKEADRNAYILTKDLNKGTYFLNSRILYIKRVKT